MFMGILTSDILFCCIDIILLSLSGPHVDNIYLILDFYLCQLFNIAQHIS